MNAVAPASSTQVNAYREIYDQLMDNAAFLWVLRDQAVDRPDYHQHDLQELDHRIEMQLDGLMAAVETSWEICSEALETGDAGEVFTAAVIAFRSHDIKKIQRVVDTGVGSTAGIRGLRSALAWLPDDLAHPWINKFLNSKELAHKLVAIGACSLRRENPGKALNRIFQRDDCREHTALYARALRLAGEIQRLDLLDDVLLGSHSEDPEVRFWAIWAAILLGRRQLVSELQPFVVNHGELQSRAIDIAFRVLPTEEARQWISSLGKNPENAATVIRACGILGDPQAVDWLIAKMDEDRYARLCGEAFTTITGVDLESQQLVRPAPASAEDEEDSGLELSDDEFLPWPDRDKLQKLWLNLSQGFTAGQRYFLGRSADIAFLHSKLEHASLRQRRWAAIELMLIDPSAPLVNVATKSI